MLTPPWDTDQAALNASEILDEVAHKTGRFREQRDQAVWCTNCSSGKRRLVRTFVGPDDSGAVREWLLVPGHQLAGRKVPSLCAPAPAPGEAWRPLYGHCSRCRSGVVVLYPDADGLLESMRRGLEEHTLILRFGRAESDAFDEGDETTAVRGGDRWRDGPFRSWLMEVGMPTLGVAVAD